MAIAANLIPARRAGRMNLKVALRGATDSRQQQENRQNPECVKGGHHVKTYF
jgi:hypothetical protein